MLLFLNEPLRIVSAKCTPQKQTNLLKLKAIIQNYIVTWQPRAYCACTPERSEWTYLWDIFLRRWALRPRDTPAAIHTPVWPPFGRTSYVDQTVRYILGETGRRNRSNSLCQCNHTFVWTKLYQVEGCKGTFFYKKLNS